MSERAYHHLLHCINNTGMHTSGNRKSSANLWKKNFTCYQDHRSFFVFFFILGSYSLRRMEIIKAFRVHWLVLWIAGYCIPSTSSDVVHLRKCQPWAGTFYHKCTEILIFPFETIHLETEKEERPQSTFAGVVMTLVFPLLLYGLFRCMHYEYGRS